MHNSEKCHNVHVHVQADAKTWPLSVSHYTFVNVCTKCGVIFNTLLQ